VMRNEGVFTELLYEPVRKARLIQVPVLTQKSILSFKISLFYTVIIS